MITLEAQVPEAALAAMRAPFLDEGATPIDTPVLQPLALLLDLAGEAMRPRLFVVQADGIDEAALRPDFTISVAQAHIDSGQKSGRYLYEGKAFRVAPQGSGRAEEFLQIGVESFGQGDPAAADAAMAGLAWRAGAAGGRSDLTLEMGDTSLFPLFLDALGLPKSLASHLRQAFRRPRSFAAELDRAQSQAPAAQTSRLAMLLAGLPEAEAAQALTELWGLAGVQPVGGRAASEIVSRLAERAEAAKAPALDAAAAQAIRAFLAISDRPAATLKAIGELATGPGLDKALDVWSDRLAAMIQAGAPEDRMRLSPAFGRAFGYYDGFLFEVRSAALDAERPVSAGGRYDGLMTRLGARARTGAVGCMVRPWRAWSEGER